MFSENVDLRNFKYTGYTLPPQALPTKDKTEDWQNACMDALENIGIRQISRKNISFEDTFRILQGNFKYKDVINSSAFLSEVDFLRNQSSLSNNLEHFGFVEPIVNHLIGEYIKMPNPVHIYADDPFSVNDYIQAKTDNLWSSVNQQVEDMLNLKMIKQGINPFEEQFQSQEQQQQYEQQIKSFKQENTPAAIEKEMNENWRAVYIEWAEATLKSDYALYDIDELDRESLYQYLATGQCFRHFMVGYDYYEPENWGVTDTFNDDSVTKVEDGDFVGQIKYVSGNQVVARWGQLFSEDEKRKILRSKDFDKNGLSYYKQNSSSSIMDWAQKDGAALRFVPHANYYPYRNMQYIQEETGLDLGIPNDFPNGNQYQDYYNDTDRSDLVRYVYGYWVSYQRIGYLTLFDEDIQDLKTEKVTDEILKEYLKENKIKQLRTISLEQHEKEPKPDTIVWDYLPQVWKGLKVCKNNTDLQDDLYKGIEPLEYQLKGNSQEYHTKLPVVGINERTSFVSRLEQEQIAYNIAMNMARDYMTKELGVFYVFDMTFLPDWIKDAGGEEAFMKMQDIIRESGILPLDGENTRSNFNQFTAINLDLTQAMLGKLEYAQAIKRIAFEKVGFTPERLGTPTPDKKTATSINQSTTASFNQTEVWFDKFSKFQKRYAEVHLNIAQYIKKEGIDGTVNLVDDYRTRTFINMSDPLLPLRRFRITPDTSTKRRSELDIIKRFYTEDNTISKDLESLAEVISSDSVSKVIQLARYGRQLAEVRQQQAQEHELKKIEADHLLEDQREDKEREWKSREADLDRRAAILEKSIVALGFEKDNNQKGQDIVDQAKFSLENLKVAVEQQRDQRDRAERAADKEKENRLKQRELDIKQTEAETKARAVTIPLEVANSNKNQYELRAAGKLKQEKKKK